MYRELLRITRSNDLFVAWLKLCPWIAVCIKAQSTILNIKFILVKNLMIGQSDFSASFIFTLKDMYIACKIGKITVAPKATVPI